VPDCRIGHEEGAAGCEVVPLYAGPVSALFADYRPHDSGTRVPVVVRELAGGDVEACVALAVQRDGGEPAAWRASFERSLHSANRRTFVAVLDGGVVGYATAGWFAPSALAPGSAVPDGWFLLGLVVDPGRRRHGIGGELTRARLAWLEERTDRAWYFVSSANRASIDLHTGFGFQLVASDIDVPGVAFTASGQLFRADLSR